MFLALLLPIILSIIVEVVTEGIRIKKRDCPPHKYCYIFNNDIEYLQCEDCNFIPGRF